MLFGSTVEQKYFKCKLLLYLVNNEATKCHWLVFSVVMLQLIVMFSTKLLFMQSRLFGRICVFNSMDRFKSSDQLSEYVIGRLYPHVYADCMSSEVYY